MSSPAQPSPSARPNAQQARSPPRSPERQQEARRWANAEPVLHGVNSEQTLQLDDIEDYVVQTVVTAIEELQVERRRRAIEWTAFANLWHTSD